MEALLFWSNLHGDGISVSHMIGFTFVIEMLKCSFHVNEDVKNEHHKSLMGPRALINELGKLNWLPFI